MKKQTKLQHARQAEGGRLTDLGKLLTEVANPSGPVTLPSFAVADVPTAADYTGQLIYCSNGAAGSPILAFSDGTNWLRSDTGDPVSAA